MSRFSNGSFLLVLCLTVACKDKNEIKVTPQAKVSPVVLPQQVDKPVPTQTLGPVTPPQEEPIVEVKPEPKVYKEFMTAGKEALTEKNLEVALGHFQKAAEAKPDFMGPQLALARVLLDKGDFEAAKPYADRAVEIEETSSAAWNTKGRVELALGNLDESGAAFERAIEENPDNSHAWNNLGYVRLKQERYEDAARALESATTGTAVTPYMWNNLGMAYEHLNQLDDARSAYRRAAESGSDRADKSLERLKDVKEIVPVVK